MVAKSCFHLILLSLALVGSLPSRCLAFSVGSPVTAKVGTMAIPVQRPSPPARASRLVHKASGDDGREPEKVNVNLIPDVDAVTLTAIGFGLIAFNFLVLANMGDGGIAGTVATIINKMKE